MAFNLIPVIFGLSFLVIFVLLAKWTRKNYHSFKEIEGFAIFTGGILLIVMAIIGMIYVTMDISDHYGAIGAYFVLLGILILGSSIIYNHFKPPKKRSKRKKRKPKSKLD